MSDLTEIKTLAIEKVDKIFSDMPVGIFTDHQAAIVINLMRRAYVAGEIGILNATLESMGRLKK